MANDKGSKAGFKSISTLDAEPVVAAPTGPVFRGVTFGPEYAPDAGPESAPIGWAVYYVETRDGKVTLASKLDDAGPKNVAQEIAKLALVRRVLMGNWE